MMRAVPPTTSRHKPDWRDQSACRDQDPELFFASTDEAKAYCARCPVTSECLQRALEVGEEYGVFGGLDEKERRTLRRRRAHPISIDDYTDTPRPPQKARTLEEAWADFTEVDGDHVLWIGPQVVNQPGGHVTPNRLAFRLDRGQWPEGPVQRTCTTAGCVRPAHLEDTAERQRRTGATKAAV